MGLYITRLLRKNEGREMRFNVVYGNHAHDGYHIGDTLRLIKYSLESVGHIASISKNMEAGVTNIIIENFTYDFIEAMKTLKLVPNTHFILLATEYISDTDRFNDFAWSGDQDISHYSNDALWTKRWKTFCLASEMSIAIWHLSESQVQAYQKQFVDIPVGYLPHGYLPELKRVPERKSLMKDIDVLFTGTITPYREIIIKQLQDRGLRVMVGKIDTPDHVREDWIGRSKVAINLKQNPNWLYPSNSRFFYHIINHSVLVTEKCEVGCDLDPYVIHANSDNFVETVLNVLDQDLNALADEKFLALKRERPIEPLIKSLLEQTLIN